MSGNLADMAENMPEDSSGDAAMGVAQDEQQTQSGAMGEAAQEKLGDGSLTQIFELLRELKNGQDSMAAALASLQGAAAPEQLSGQEEPVQKDAQTSGENTIAEGLMRLEAGIEKLGANNRAALEAFNDFRTNLGRGWHDELKSYRELFAMGAYDNIMKRLAEIYIAIFYLSKEKNDEKFAEDMEWTVLDPLRELMESYGVSMQVTEPGKKRSLRSMRSARLKPTGDKALDGIVSCSVTPGFLRAGENDAMKVVLIPEEIEHYSYREEHGETGAERSPGGGESIA